jgi:hypothetical protein
VLFAYAISRFASTIYGLRNGLIWDADYFKMVTEELTTGQHRKPEIWNVFTTTFFHHPDELKAELEEAGFMCEELIGIQGPGWIVPDFDESLKAEERRAIVLSIARLVEKEPALSPHMVAIARWPR